MRRLPLYVRFGLGEAYGTCVRENEIGRLYDLPGHLGI
jgi:hypothetical protein